MFNKCHVWKFVWHAASKRRPTGVKTDSVRVSLCELRGRSGWSRQRCFGPCIGLSGGRWRRTWKTVLAASEGPRTAVDVRRLSPLQRFDQPSHLRFGNVVSNSVTSDTLRGCWQSMSPLGCSGCTVVDVHGSLLIWDRAPDDLPPPPDPGSSAYTLA